jgi:hypothetical protein
MKLTDFTKWSVPMLFIGILLIVFLSQSGGIGFWDKHHGWSSSHGLAIMSRATPENLFVGYARTFRSADGVIGYDYFDRYPFFFSAFMGTLINLFNDLPTKVFLARQVMNTIFVAMMLFAYLLINKLLHRPLLAVGIMLLSFSSASLLYYRDMIHYDQPALLGMFILLYAIARVKLDGQTRWLTLAALVAVSLGRGYASLSVLGLWFAFEALGLLVNRQLTFAQRIRRILMHEATRALVLSLVWVSLLLGYNLVVEAARREIPLEQTSIVDSALRRLPIGEQIGDQFDTEEKPVPPWGEYVQIMADRVARWSLPGGGLPDEFMFSPWGALLSTLAALFIVIFSLRQPPARRIVLLLTAFSGLAWITFMVNLTYEHDYTTMYAVGFALIAYSVLFSGLRRVRHGGVVLALVGLGVFGTASQQVYARTIDDIRASNVYTEDYERVRQAIDGQQRMIYDVFPEHCAILNSKCYVLGFYLGDNYLTGDLEAADYVLTPYPYHASRSFLPPDDTEGLLLMAESLTPENTVSHLFAVAQAEQRFLPEDLETLFVFGEEVALDHWVLRESVEVQSCQRVHLESWWHRVSLPQANYSMQIALVDSDGQAIGAANTSLTHVATEVWGPDAYFLDARGLTIPCAATPGEYALVMSVYDPQTVQSAGSLLVTLPDGQPSGDFVYLTTLFVDAVNSIDFDIFPPHPFQQVNQTAGGIG